MVQQKSKAQQLPDVEYALNQIHRDSICTATREIWLHSCYAGEEEPGVDYRMASMFLKNINVLEKDATGPILIHMHCIGGEWNDGMAVYDAIRLSPCHTTIIAYAQASSMSGIILQAAKVRLMMPNCEFMAHTGVLDLSQESRTALTMVERNVACHHMMLGIFAERCRLAPKHFGLSLSSMSKRIDDWIKDKGEINILAREAVEYGFSDGVIGDEQYPTVYHVWRKLGKVPKVTKAKNN